jgi:release factor glutamine methyltransferase
VPTIRELIKATTPWLEKKGVDNARLDAELLVAHALGLSRVQLYTDLDRPLGDDEVTKCRALVVRRGQREPVSQIVGAREFFGLRFLVTKDVLTPRPETEHLVEAALNRVGDVDGTFVDACTGSGCVALAILSRRQQLRAIATDQSAAALAVAKQNAAALRLEERVDFRETDLLANVDVEARFVVANPPYITKRERDDLAPEVKDHEPALALFGEGDDGLGHHRRILEQSKRVVVAGGFVALEIGAAQGEIARNLVVDGFGAAVIERDLDGRDRVAIWSRH